ncbi:signal peptidase I [Arsenicicoccus cauae]|uniref:signal peptidase I n=1 Tax=Arsenicicoccus cauae TaxID=2663847 RepID=UPI00338D7BA4
MTDARDVHEDPTPGGEAAGSRKGAASAERGGGAVSSGQDAAGSRSGASRSSGTGSHLMHAVREFVIVVGLALVLSLAVKTWLMQAFYIPSGSMEDTLVEGDRVVVSKLTPRPFELERGDVVVFEDTGRWLVRAPTAERSGIANVLHETFVFVGLLPNDSDSHLIKRVIGLPGDKVTCCTQSGKLTVNGAEITESYLKPGDAPSVEPFDITVPQGRLWVMGDHRSDSGDSRYHDPSRDGSTGSVPIDDVVGRAVAVVWPFSEMTWLGQPSTVFSAVPDAR